MAKRRPLEQIIIIMPVLWQWFSLGPTAAFAQSDQMSLLTLAPSTSASAATVTAADTAMSTEATTAASTASTSTDSTALTEILYPTGLPTVNYEDTVLVSYNTPWNGANLSVYCDDGQGDYVSYDDDNLPSSGVVNLSPIQGPLDLSNYPVQCHILLTDSTDSGEWINDGVFTITSTSGAVETYGASSTGTAPTPTTSETESTDTNSPASTNSSSHTDSTTLLSSSKGASTASQTSSTSNTAASSSPLSPSSSSSSSLSSSFNSPPSNSGLSGGAIAGIVIAVLVVSFLLLAAFIYQHRRHQSSLIKLPPQSEQVNERAMPSPIQGPEKPYIGSMKPRNPRTPVTPGPKILSAEDMRQSGDWKKFFSAKAASAAGSLGEAAAAVGSAISNSRPGSRRASTARSRLRPDSGKEQKELPRIPPLPKRISVATMPNSLSYFSDSVAGEPIEYMSTTSLVAPRRR